MFLLCRVFFQYSTIPVHTFCLHQVEHLQVLCRRSCCIWGRWSGYCTHSDFSPRLITSLLDSLRWLWQVLCFPSAGAEEPWPQPSSLSPTIKKQLRSSCAFSLPEAGKWMDPTQINFSRAESQNIPGLVWWEKVNQREVYELLLTRLC